MDKNLLKFVDLELKLQLFAATKLFLVERKFSLKQVDQHTTKIFQTTSQAMSE